MATLQDCPRESLQALANLAVSPLAFDDPSTWYLSQVNSVGCILNGMSREDIASIPPEGFESFTPNIIQCLSGDTFKVIKNLLLIMENWK